VADGSCPQEKVITRTWAATDDCGNSSTCDQVIAVVDDEAPVITCPADITVECSPDITQASCLADLIDLAATTDTSVTGVATATDNCDPAPAISLSDSVAAGTCAQEQVVTRTWTGTDACGNSSNCDQVITAVDDEAPAITCPADTTVDCSPTPGNADCLGDILGTAGTTDVSVTSSATATDNCDSSPAVSLSDSVAAGTCPQEKVITRTWTATDGCANSSSCDQIITVADNDAPSITCPADVTVDCDDDSSSAATGSATATDNCDTDVTVTESDSVVR